MKKIRTIISHHGEDYQRYLGAIAPPIFENSNFAFSSYEDLEEYFLGRKEKYIYTRDGNPIVEILEKKLALLEKGEKAKVLTSGVSAITFSILSLVRSGDHIISVRSIYDPTYQFLTNFLNNFNIQVDFVDGKSIEEIENSIKPNTKIIFLESPTSFLFELQDLINISKVAKRHGIYTIIDNTWATPYFQNPIEFGIDIVVHSASKYLSGHSDVVAGAVITSERLIKGIEKNIEIIGGNIGPFEAWLILRGLRTLPIRMEAHQNNAMEVAKFLESHPRVIKVNYPGLFSHPQYDLAKKLMRGFSGVFSFEIEGGEKEVRKFINNLRIFTIAVSWGGYESLVFPGKFAFSKNRKDKISLPENLIRVSIGLEDVSDIIEDLEEALKKAYL